MILQGHPHQGGKNAGGRLDSQDPGPQGNCLPTVVASLVDFFVDESPFGANCQGNVPERQIGGIQPGGIGRRVSEEAATSLGLRTHKFRPGLGWGHFHEPVAPRTAWKPRSRRG